MSEMSENLPSKKPFPIQKVILLVLLALLVGLAVYFDLPKYLSLAQLKSQKDLLEAKIAEEPVLSSAVFLFVYVLTTALSLPGAVVLTLAGGALFGFLWGFLLVSFASSIGATLAFLATRFLLREWVQDKFAKFLNPINRGVSEEGAFYLFTLRLVPLFPFFVINLVLGLTPMRAVVFYWVSQVGMLPGTMVYVNAGTQLASLDSLSGIASPRILLSFALLGIFPLFAKKVVNWFRKKSAKKTSV